MAITYENVLGVNADSAEEYRERRGEQEAGVLVGVPQGEYARAHVALKVVHQGLYVPGIKVYMNPRGRLRIAQSNIELITIVV